MKKVVVLILGVAFVVVSVVSCSSYTCPAYVDNSQEQVENNG